MLRPDPMSGPVVTVSQVATRCYSVSQLLLKALQLGETAFFFPGIEELVIEVNVEGSSTGGDKCDLGQFFFESSQ